MEMKLFSKRKQKCVMAEQEAMASDIADVLLSHIWSISYLDKQWIEELSIFSKQPISSWRWFHTVRMKMLLIAAPCVLFGMQIATQDGSYLSTSTLVFPSGFARSCCCVLWQGEIPDLRKAQLHDSCTMGIAGQVWVSSSALEELHAHVNVPKDTSVHVCSKLHRAQFTFSGREESQVTICLDFFSKMMLQAIFFGHLTSSCCIIDSCTTLTLRIKTR